MKKILIVDDDLSTCEVLTLVFGHYQVKTYNTTSGLAGLINDYLPDFILMDIQLPGKADLCQLIKNLQVNLKTQNTPIVYISALSTKEITDFCDKTNINKYFEKPFDIFQILATVDSYFA